MDTIFALSSGAPPAAIGVIRISGPAAGTALQALAGSLPEPRKTSLRRLRTSGGDVLDEAMILWFPGPDSATGEDLAELHCHGGRAVVRAIEDELGATRGLRKALPGEFTRRAFANGRIDLSEVEGLADLLEAETEMQRASAMAMAGGALSRQAEQWREAVLGLSALIESALDFSDEDDVSELPDTFSDNLEALRVEIEGWLERPKAEKLREGYRVVIAGPPNAGKSTLFNALTDSEAAITSPVAGTTRDVIERSVSLEGIPFSFIDTAGLRDDSSDEIEMVGIGRARDQLLKADCILWLGAEGQGPQGSYEVEAQMDLPSDAREAKPSPDFQVSALRGEGVDDLRAALVAMARDAMPRPGEVALNERQHALFVAVAADISDAARESDLLLKAEGLRRARASLDAVMGKASTEDMLDALFGRFCIGK